MAVATTEMPARREGVPEAGWFDRLGTLAPIIAQLGLALLVVRQFQLESNAFFRVLLVASTGFIVHGLLPLRHRLSFFLLLSFVAIGAALGIRDGLWLVGAGLSLIAACHLPIPFGLRVGLVLLLGAGYAFARAGLVEVPWSAAVWPILGSMFMFRMALYLYALRHDPSPPTWQRSLAYFFMLPNMAYPLFPVVDFTTFGRTYYDAPESRIYERGTQWIARGLLHLLLYRFVYLNLTIPGSEIRDAGDLARSMISTFLLYLRVSGQFHIAIGILQLFGFHLPETHKLYYLASSFTDFWRRINIYWKDFMMKLVYYPSFFRLRRFGDRVALAVSTAIVFVTTWLLHSYQWFWLQGGFPISMPDAAFWGLLGVFVIVATLRELARGRKRTLQKPKAFDASRAARTTVMFCTLTILWSLWSTESIADWLWHWSAITRGSLADVALIGGTLGIFFLIAGHSWDAPAIAATEPLTFYRRPMVRTFALLGGLLLVGQPAVYDRTGPRLAGLVGSLRSNALNVQDSERQFLGYYERLDDEGALADVGRARAVVPASPEWRAFTFTAASRARTDFLVHDIEPGQQVRFKGALLSTNRWGMRDGEYTLEKQPGVKRIAIVGHSVTMGSGVNDAEVFEQVMERELNATAPGGTTRYEILNFSVAGYSLLQQMALLEDRVFQFEPDVVIVSAPAPAHMRQHLLSHLTRQILARGLPVPYPEVREMFARQGIDTWGGTGPGVPYRPLRALVESLGGHAVMPVVEAESRLDPVLDEMVTWSIARMGAAILDHGAAPVLLAMDDVQAVAPPHVPVKEAARASGFVVIDMFDLYRGRRVDSLRIAPWDDHPNAAGHRLIAERLLGELREHETTLNLGLAPQPAASTNSPRE